ncbi:NAD(P)-dependent oxidoreductase [Oceanicola sp. 502str15]|uniref:NAD-dependent epimerase/dehydratase family protein n=1 Tax=Oceanicola sp. 502str15 TaxID=2696061 RepID=UPI002094BDC0|nr:NAD(P)-dependent oxidoreductase [Oceanicola sp. 502str15]MCO6384418.1 SDR family oxidoreductase [Oceanicola sp. 502str15]
MTRVLLTGGTGFIGQRVARKLAEQGVTPCLLDLPKALHAFSLPEGWEAVEGDVTDAASVASAMEAVDGVVHLAGIMTVDCAANPRRAFDINLLGSLHVFEAARARKLPVAYLSSAGVYGPEDADNPHPMSIYGVTKLAVEGIARVYEADHGVPSLGLRPYIVYGPGISSGIASGPSVALAASVKREPAVIRFSGRVGFVHVDDVARVLAAAMTGEMTGAGILTMAGDTREMDAFIAELKQQTGWDGITYDGPKMRIPETLANTPAPEWLGPQPVTTIEQGIASSLADLRGASA